MCVSVHVVGVVCVACVHVCRCGMVCVCVCVSVCMCVGVGCVACVHVCRCGMCSVCVCQQYYALSHLIHNPIQFFNECNLNSVF